MNQYDKTWAELSRDKSNYHEVGDKSGLLDKVVVIFAICAWTYVFLVVVK